MNLSVKAKILSSIISLSVFGLSVFGYFTFQTFKHDKLAFVYDYLTNETQSKSALFTMATEDNELFLSSIISRIDIKTKNSLDSVKSFLEGDQKKIMGLYYHVPSEATLSEQTLFEGADQTTRAWSWKDLNNAPLGVSIIDRKNGYFLLKKELGEDSGFAAMVFKQIELWNILSSTEGRHNFILNKNRLIAKETVKLDTAAIIALKPRMLETPGSFGLFEEEIEGEPYFVTYSKLGSDDLILMNLIQSKKVLLVQDILFRQILGFLVLMVSISLLIGTIAARWLTWHLDGLTQAAVEMENENFDIQVEVTSNDELGTLGNAFNNMGSRIKNLLEELRIYNLELEQKVKERTLELQSLTDIQKGMVNALGQGFVIIDKEHKILPVYSKVAETMFEVIPDEVEPREIMGVDETQGAAFKEFFDMVFANAIGFDDMARLAPELRTNSKHQQIALSYAPITSGDGQETEFVLVVGTDKTQEFENMEKFKKEWNFSQMIMKIASNRFALNKIISESLNMLTKCMDYVHADHEYALRDVQRLIHTIKGSFSYFYIQDITHLCHDLESYLGTYYDEKHCPPDQTATILERVMAIQVALECYIDHYDNIIQYKDAASCKSVPVDELIEFSNYLKKKSPELEEMFTQKFFKTEVSPYFQMYPTIVKELGTKLNKEVQFKMRGGNTAIPDGPWEEIFQQFIHFVRNSVDHGIETADDRREAGKVAHGEIVFDFKVVENALHVTLSDDGRGVNWEKIAAKDPSVKSLEDALERIKTGGISSKDEVSDTSGRGVGVSSLFSAIEQFGGTSTFESFAGTGMKITMKLPFANLKKKDLKLVA